MIEIGINSEIFAQILNGSKTIEGRLAKDKFTAIHPGDLISIREDTYKDGAVVESRSAVAKIQVVNIKKYDSFRTMLLNVGFNKVIPNAKDLDEACDEYERYYSSDDEHKYGVLAISFQVVSP